MSGLNLTHIQKIKNETLRNKFFELYNQYIQTQFFLSSVSDPIHGDLRKRLDYIIDLAVLDTPLSRRNMQDVNMMYKMILEAK